MPNQVTKEEALKRVDSVLEKATAAIESTASTGRVMDQYDTARRNVTTTESDNGWVNCERAQAFRSAGLTLLRDFYGEEHHHYVDFNQNVQGNVRGGYTKGRALISVVREEIDGGLLTNTCPHCC